MQMFGLIMRFDSQLLHVVVCSVVTFDIYIASTVALAGQSAIRLPVLPWHYFILLVWNCWKKPS